MTRFSKRATEWVGMQCKQAQRTAKKDQGGLGFGSEDSRVGMALF
jgi:hypothetical protein